jgi:predicted TIM-barrel enzyme
MNPENIKSYLPLADGFIVGSTFRKDGKFLEETVPARINKFVKKFKEERRKIL